MIKDKNYITSRDALRLHNQSIQGPGFQESPKNVSEHEITISRLLSINNNIHKVNSLYRRYM